MVRTCHCCCFSLLLTSVPVWRSFVSLFSSSFPSSCSLLRFVLSLLLCLCFYFVFLLRGSSFQVSCFSLLVGFVFRRGRISRFRPCFIQYKLVAAVCPWTYSPSTAGRATLRIFPQVLTTIRCIVFSTLSKFTPLHACLVVPFFS